MSFVLGSVTLPNPVGFRREYVETAQENMTLQGKNTKRWVNRKERFILTWELLTQAEVSSILSEYELDMVRSFQVTEVGLTVAPTDVLVDTTARQYLKTGTHYLEKLTIVLVEVK